MASVAELAERFMQFQLEEFPEYATYRGFKLYEDRLDIVNVDFYNRRQAFYRQLYEDATKLETTDLAKTDKITLHLLQNHARTVLDGIKYGQHFNTLNYYEGADVIFQRFAMKNMTLETADGYRKLLKRLSKFPAKIDGSIELFQAGVDSGVVQHEIAIVPQTLQRLEKAAATKPEDLSFYSPFKDLPLTIPSAEREELRTEAMVTMETCILPALTKLYKFVKEVYVPVLRTDCSIESVPGPAGRYQAMLRYHCDLDVTPEQVHNMGLQRIAIYKERVQKIMEQERFTGNMMEFSEHLQSDSEMSFRTGEEILEYCKSIVNDRIRLRLHKVFNIPVDCPLEFVSDTNAKCVTKAIYYGPPYDGSRNSELQVWTGNPPMFVRHETPVLMLHETYPGHHFETCSMMSRKSLPTFRRVKDDRRYNDLPSRTCMHSAYTEGWGLYCESLGEELNIYETPLEEFGYLMCNMIRSARAVADTGIHHFKWSREEALQYLVENTCMPAEGRVSEVDRFITWPGQGASYMVGFLKMKELRSKAENALGEKFDIRAFHDAVLAEGQVPLTILEEIIDIYINENKN